MRCASAVASGESNRHNSTLVACSENSAKLTPFPSHVAPNGKGRPGHTLIHGSPRVGFDSLCRSGRPRVVLRIVSKLQTRFPVVRTSPTPERPTKRAFGRVGRRVARPYPWIEYPFRARARWVLWMTTGSVRG